MGDIFWDDGKEHGNYFIVHWDYIVYWGYIGIMETRKLLHYNRVCIRIICFFLNVGPPLQLQLVEPTIEAVLKASPSCQVCEVHRDDFQVLGGSCLNSLQELHKNLQKCADRHKRVRSCTLQAQR